LARSHINGMKEEPIKPDDDFGISRHRLKM
jgi:hypothetical protein